MIEPLESRIALASGTLLDADGDKVTFTISTGSLSGVVFENHTVTDPYSVFTINLSGSEFDGVNLTVSVTKGKVNGVSGDGQVVIGKINGGANNFGTIKIAGDLGDIDAGSGSTLVPAIKSLTVNSYGRFGENGGDAYSQIKGNVGALTVKGDFIATNFYVTGDLTTVRIGGSVIGGPVAGDGQIYATGELGKVTIKKDLRGGSAASTGFIGAGFNVGTVTIGGSIYGGQGDNSGNVFAALSGAGKITKVTVGGSIFGGVGENSGYIGSTFVSPATANRVDIASVTVGKDLVGGGGINSGLIEATNDGTLGTVLIKGSIVGSGSSYGGSVYASGSIGTVTVQGSVIGGVGDDSGTITGNDNIGSVTVGGSLFGGEGKDSALIYSKHIDAATIGGSLYGGKGNNSGGISASGLGIDLLKIRGDVRGGSGVTSGCADGGGQIDKQTIGGLVIPGTGTGSGTVS